MHRLGISFLLLLSVGVAAQTSTSPGGIIRDAQATSLLAKAIAALSSGTAVSDVRLTGTATRIAGSDQESGQVLFEAKGTQESKIVLSLTGYTYTEVRSFSNGSAIGSYVGPDGVIHVTALHNCFADAAWFFPLLSSAATALSNPGLNAAYIGQEAFNGRAVQHVATWQSVSSPDSSAVLAIAHLSTMDWYLDATTSIPLGVRFTTHPDNNSSADLAVEVRLSNYQLSSGVLVPFHVQKFLNGGLILDLSLSSAVLNTGIPDTDFILQ